MCTRVQPCGLVALAPFIHPVWRTHLVLSLSAAAAVRRWITFFKVSLNSQKIPTYGYRSSKDSGPSDCQLGVPKRPISSQGRGKKQTFQRRTQEKKKSVLWRALKNFMPPDYNSGIFLPLLGVSEGQTVILKGLAYLRAVRRWVPAPFDDAFQ